jgi:hypothetical protein
VLAFNTDVTVEQLWQECQTKRLPDVAKSHGVTWQRLVGEFIEAGLTGNRGSDPSPGEIARMTGEIRANWTPAQEHARWIAARRHEDGVLNKGV